MNGLEQTQPEYLYKQNMPGNAGVQIVTVLDGNEAPFSFTLDSSRREIRFGRATENELCLRSLLVSRMHGRFICRNGAWFIEDKAAYAPRGSTNGLIINGLPGAASILRDGDMIRIDGKGERKPEGVLFIVSRTEGGNRWTETGLSGKTRLRIGRSRDCDICLPHISVSGHHAEIFLKNGRHYICDTESKNGVLVNGRRVRQALQLHEKDVINITNSRLIYTASRVYSCCYKDGITVDAVDATVIRGKGEKAFVTADDITLRIGAGELAALIGGSGAGKSTVLNCLCGYLPPDRGNVYINGVDLYENFDTLKSMIGYVPQADIVYDNLTVHDMLLYAARLRLPGDASPAEIEGAIDRALATVDLADKKESYIRALSGGQKKRASIAVELLNDPSLLFLDEPASGLDPGTERKLMQSLRKMADSGKTVILVTHSTLQLRLCDSIVFMGRGGKLCFCGSFDRALQFFGVPDIIDTYGLIAEDAGYWQSRYARSLFSRDTAGEPRQTELGPEKRRGFQLGVLCARYARLIVNDRQRFLLLLLQAPLLALLISVVADGEQYEMFKMTNSLMFALACCSFWVGILNAIQEICKERVIVKREYMTGLSLDAYLLSKFLILGALCLLQSVLVLSVFALLVGLPEEGLIMHPMPEMLITFFLSAAASAAMGLFVSSLFTNADRAMTLAPILLMPQILFSGVIFQLEGLTETVSWLAVCRWAMEGLGSIANLNALPPPGLPKGAPFEPVVNDFYEYTAAHLTRTWLILLAFIVGFLLLARLALNRIRRQ